MARECEPIPKDAELLYQRHVTVHDRIVVDTGQEDGPRGRTIVRVWRIRQPHIDAGTPMPQNND
jgi:hypothetical protein